MLQRLLSWLSPKEVSSTEESANWVDFHLPATASDIPDYKTAFDQAMRFTAKCGFPVNDFAWRDDALLDSEGGFLDPVLRAAGVKDVSKSAGQCLKWCHYLAPYLEQQLGSNVHVTIGQIWYGDKAAFNPSWEDLRRWASGGIELVDFKNRSGLNLHAWLTLETGEIIEPTLLSSFAAVRGDSWTQYAGAMAWGYDPDVLNHRYFPMAIGMAYAENLASRSIMPLLATSPAELTSTGFLLVRE